MCIRDRFSFQVEAIDHGRPPLKDTARVILKIENVNDNNPTFKKPSYYKEILEDTRRGRVIEKVEAFDPDELSVAEFGYSIEEGNQDGCFTLDQYEGVIRLMCDLNFKRKNLYNLKLKVTDGDNKAGYAFFKIKVLDANNNQPK